MAIHTTQQGGKAVGANGSRAQNAPQVNVELLKRLTETPGVSGREEQVRALVIEELKPLWTRYAWTRLATSSPRRRARAIAR